MKNLFLIDGAAGTGKTDSLNFIQELSTRHGYAFALSKYSTREKRDNDTDIIPLPDVEFEERKCDSNKRNVKFYQYQYPLGKFKYGIEKDKIDNALMNYRNVYIIIRSSNCIKEIREDYARYRNVNVVPILIYTDIELVKERLQREGNTAEQVNKRLSRTNNFMLDFYSQPYDFYKEIVLNNSDKSRFRAALNAILEKYNKEQTHSTDLKAFIIMPMGDDGDDKIKELIQQGARNAGFDAKRVDDIKTPSRKLIIQKAYKAIEQADVCVADLSKTRPNCYLEVGYAQAMDKPIFGIIKDGEGLHFDESGYEYTFYGDGENWEDRLRKKIEEKLSEWKKEYYL